MAEFRESLDKLLRSGKTDQALKAAAEWCAAEGATRETAIEIARTAAAVYRDLIAQPVHDFAAGAEKALPEEVGPTVAKAIARLVKMTEEWENRLWGIHTERLTREIREWTRQKHYDPAAANVARLMALMEPNQRARRAVFIGNVLGTVIHNQDEAQKLIKLLARSPGQYFLDCELLAKMEQGREKRFKEMEKMRLEAVELEWSRQITQEAVEIKNRLPLGTGSAEPTEEELRDTGDIIRSILRVPIWKEEPDLFLDATQLLVEFSPREQSSTSRLAGVEERAYNTLGYTAKKAVVSNFLELGKNKFFTQLYAKWAGNYIGTDAIRVIIEFMGSLRTAEFNDFLKEAAGGKAATASVRARVDEALGNIAGEEAVEALLIELKLLLKKRHLELAEEKKAANVLAALGRIVKSPRTSSDAHRYIVEQLRTHVPENISRLALSASLECFLTKPQEMSEAQRQWAVRVLTRSLWLPDTTTEHHKGGERQASELGFRAPIVEGLKKLGPLELETLHHTMEPLATRFSAAYLAAAELFEAIGTDESIALLERMLTATLMHDDSAVSDYNKEFFWDATAQERRPVTKEKVLPALIFAIGQTGGARAATILGQYRDQIAMGQAPPPTPEIAGFMERFLGKDAFTASVAPETEGGPAAYDPKEVAALIKQAGSNHLLSGKDKRRVKKIEAITRLAQITPLEAMDVLFDQLADKDVMVCSAAITCLTDYASPGQRKPVRDLTIDTALEKLDSKDPAVRRAAVKLIVSIGPQRREVKDKLVIFAKTIDREDTKRALAEVLKSKPATSAAPGGNGDAESQGPDFGGALNKLELKREYLIARQEWIKGGKKGEPPAKPEGMD